MNTKRNDIKCVSLIICFVMVFTLVPWHLTYAEEATDGQETIQEELPEESEEGQPEPEDVHGLVELPDPVTEDVTEEKAVKEENTLDSTTFDLGDREKMLIMYGQDVRFEGDNGELIDYDPELVRINKEETSQGRSLSGYRYENKISDHKEYMPEILSQETPVLMENEDESIEMSPVTESGFERAELKKEKEVNAYEELKEKNLTVSYEDKENGNIYEYTSQNDGIKEEVTILEKPESNVLTFKLDLKGLLPVVTEQGRIILTDKETGEERASISEPFLNDATEDAYSEDIDMVIEEGESSDSYIIQMEISRKYLNSKERVYPVYIDPTVTWRKSESVADTYVYSNAPSTNYHSSSIKKLGVGKGKYGTYRSYIKVLPLRGGVKGKYVTAARLVVYESASSNTGRTIGAYGVKASWRVKDITWNNRPGFYAAVLGTAKTNGNAGHAVSLTVTDYVRDVANGSKTNYGLMLKNTTEPSSSYAEFCATTHGTATHRPKLVVSYTDGPSKASSVSVNKTYVKRNEDVKVSWTGIKSAALASVQYRVAQIDPQTLEVLDPFYAGYSNLPAEYTGQDGTNVTIPGSSSFPEGKYRVYLRGVDNGGIHGSGVGATFNVDGTVPVINDFDVSPETSAIEYTGDLTPEISWDVTETAISEVKVIVDGHEAGSQASVSADNYILPAGKIKASGVHTIGIEAVDMAGNIAASQTTEYFVDVDPPVIGSFTSTPGTVFNSMSNNTAPVLNWIVTDNDLESVTISKYEDGEYEELYDADGNELSSGTYTVSSGDLDQGRNLFKLTAEDSGSNLSSRTFSYYLDTIDPVLEKLEIIPVTGFFNSSGILTPEIRWSYIDQAISSVRYSMDGTTYQEMGTSKVGSFKLPESCFASGAGTYTIYVKAIDTAGNESQVSQLTYYLTNVTENDLIPTNISVNEYYGKNVITWNANGYCPSLGKIKVYRGSTSDFSISDGELIEENADNGMFIDKYVGTGSVYYRLVVVSEDTDHHVISQSSVVQGASMLRMSDLSNRIGKKEYLRYEEFNTPSGTGSVELSSGNLTYSEVDYDISNGQLEYGLTRSYNSKDVRTTAFGKGISDPYHKELYEDASGNIYYIDENGSVFSFTREGSAYTSDEGKEFTLTETEEGYEIEDKEHVVTKFDEAGRMTSTSEPNGVEVTYLYDSLGRLERVKSKADTAGDREIRLHYENDDMYVKSIDLPDDTLMRYGYTDNMLSSVSHMRNTELVASPYVRYTYSNGILVKVEDALEHEYELSYTNGRVTKIEDPIGEKDEISYGNTVTVTHKASSNVEFGQTEYSLDNSTGKVLWEEDVNGNRTSYEYTQSNDLLVKKVKTKLGWEEVDGSGNISVHSQDNVTETEYTCNGNEDVILEEESDGTSVVTTYDEDGNVAREKEYSEEELTSDTEYTYDERGNEVEAEEHVGDTLDLTEYDNEGNEVAEESREENVTTDTIETSYDDQGNALETIAESGRVTDTERAVYDEMGRTIKEVTDTGTTEYTYDVFGRTVQTDISRNGHTSHTYTVYNGNGEVVSETDERGKTTTYVYDASGRRVVVNDPASGAIQTWYGYDTNVTIKDGLNGKTYSVLKSEISLDSESQVISIKWTDPSGRVVRERTGSTSMDHTYDASGNDIVDVIWEDGSQEEMISLSLFNEKGQRFREVRKPEISNNAYSIGADSVVTTTTFTDAGNTDTEENALGGKTRYEYDEQGRMTGVFTGTGNDLDRDMTVAYSVTEDGSYTLMTDARGNMRKDTENHAGLTVLTEDIGSDGTGLRVSSEYDASGNKTKDIYSDGSRISYVYDAQDRLTEKKCFDPSGSQESVTAYTYTQFDDVQTVTYTPSQGIQVVTGYMYDTAGRKTREQVTYGSDAPSVTEYVYDDRGRLSEIHYPSSAGMTGVIYTYDALGRLVVVKNRQSGDILRRCVYGDLGRLAYTRDHVPGTGYFIKTSYGYDDLGRVISKEVTRNNTNVLIERYDVTYDKLDRISEITRFVSSEEAPVYETRTYTYDDHGRLIRSGVLDNLDEPDEGETIEDLIRYTSYEYDAAGNRIKVNDDSGETTFSYNGLDQMVYMDAPEKEVEYAYDLRGDRVTENNVTDGIVTHNEYTVEGQLRSVSEEDANGTTVIQQNAYDAYGTRVQKTEGNDVKKYYYAGNDMICTTENGDTVFTGAYDSSEIVGAYLGETPEYMLYSKDMQGSTDLLLDSGLEEVGGYTYTDYGEVTALEGTPAYNEICYTGAVYDRTTGEHYLRARYYDPDSAVFTTQDTLRGEAADSSLWNSYAYCNGDPVNRVDPSGHYYYVLLAYHPVGLVVVGVILISGVCYFAATHSKNARPSTWNKHTKPRSGRKNVKARKSKKWKDKSNKRK